MNDIEKLLSKLTFTSDTMTSIKCGIKGKAFFPGGRGIYDDDNDYSLSNKSVMILGQDFDTKKNYEVSKNKGNEKNPTWEGLRKLLLKTPIKLNDCFYTNAIMGVRNTNRNTGKSPAFKDKEYIEKCQEFFLYQLEIQKPVKILVLGLRTAEFLSKTSLQLESWKSIASFKSIDEKNDQIRKDILFKNNIKSDLVLLMHPSARKYNLDSRKYGDVEGMDAQIKMINELYE